MQKVKRLKGFFDILPDGTPIKNSQFAASQKLGVDFRQLSQPALKFHICGDAGAGLLALFRCFEQKLSHLAGSQALNQIIERAVLETPATSAIWFAARQILTDGGCSQQIRWRIEPRQQSCFPFLQGSGLLGANCLNHIYIQRQISLSSKYKNAALLVPAHDIRQYMDDLFVVGFLLLERHCHCLAYNFAAPEHLGVLVRFLGCLRQCFEKGDELVQQEIRYA